MRKKLPPALFLAPAFTVFAAFFLLPVARLLPESAGGQEGWWVYVRILQDSRYWGSLVSTVVLALAVTAGSQLLGGVAGLFLERASFKGRGLLIAALTLPISFPGVVVGFMVIMLAGRQGLAAAVTGAAFGSRLVFAYSAAGLFVGYLYFSIPRVVTTVMAAASKLDRSLEEAARTLGASPGRVVWDVTIPALLPALVSTGAICFSTSIGAFGTAFTLATDINVLPIVIYTEYTLSANIAVAAALSLVLGLTSWTVLFAARLATGLETAGHAA
ncbi:MAG: ABC transporter permease [Deltaproteobacteria bacterium]|jgi:putative spermidine/putrescine transport system permease protein|nr:ABC transporter permease [Deltaproteobacteria bacterium]